MTIKSYLYRRILPDIHLLHIYYPMEPFIHLHVHTQYSLLDGQASIDALIDKAHKDGMRAIAVTDHGVMFGIKEFFNKVNKKNGKYKDTIKKAQTKRRLNWKSRFRRLKPQSSSRSSVVNAIAHVTDGTASSPHKMTEAVGTLSCWPRT